MPRQGSLRVLADVAGSLAPRPQIDPAARRTALERWASTLSGASAAMRRFLAILAPLAARSRELECFPSQAYLAARLGTSTRAVQKLVARARAEGWIEVRASAYGRRRRGNVYRLLPPWAAARQRELVMPNKVRHSEPRKFVIPFLINTKVENAPTPTRAKEPAPLPSGSCPKEPAPPPDARLPAGQAREGSPSGSPCHPADSHPVVRMVDEGPNPSPPARAVPTHPPPATGEQESTMNPEPTPAYLAFKRQLEALKRGRAAPPGTARRLPSSDPVLGVFTLPCTHRGCAGTVVSRRYADRTEGECTRARLHD